MINAYKKILLTNVVAVTGLTVLFFILSFHSAIAADEPIIRPAYQVLKDTSSGTGAQVQSIWKTFINLLNIFVAALLIFIAFAQILRLNVNTYGVKKVLPTLILSIIAANFSFLFCRIMLDLASVAMDVFVQHKQNNDIFIGLSGSWTEPSTYNLSSDNLPMSVYLKFLGLQIIAIVGAVALLILAFLFFIRLWLIYFLVVLSPLAFVSITLPQTKKLFDMWWSNFSKWTFMPIISVFWLWVGNQWLKYLNIENGGGSVMTFVFSGACIYLAITTPLKAGGAIMGAWSNLGKRTWNATGGKVGKAAWNSTGGAAINATRTGINTRWDRQKDKLKNRWYATPMGQGMLSRGARQTRLTELEKDVHTKRIGDAAKNEYYRAYQDHVSGRRRLHPAQESRLFAKMRSAIGEERETFASLPPERLRPELERRNALYTAAEIARFGLNPALEGTLKTEQHMTETMNREQHHETKAIIARARQMLSSQITRQPTLDVMGYTDTTGTRHDGIIPQPYEASWRSGDIARNLYATSAVGATDYGDTFNDVNQKLAGTVGKDNAERIALAAIHGAQNIDFDAALKNSGIDLGGLSAGAQEEVKKSFDNLREARDKLIQEQLDEGNEKIEEELKGIYHIFHEVKAGHSNLGIMQLDINKAKLSLPKGGINEVNSASRLTGLPELDRRATEEMVAARRRELDTALTSMSSGIDHFKTHGIPAGIKGMNWSSYDSSVRADKSEQLQVEAEAQATSRMSMSQMATSPHFSGKTIAQVASNQDNMERLSGQLSEISKAISVSHGTTPAIIQPQTAQKAILGFADSSHISANDSIAKVFNDVRFQSRFAEQIASANMKQMRRVGTTQQPVQNVTNVTNENVTNVVNNEEAPQTPPPPPQAPPPQDNK